MVTRHGNPPRTQKPWTTVHENSQKCPKSRNLTMPLESCIEGHGAWKSTRDPKTVDYSPRKRPEMPKITSFDDAARVVYRSHRPLKSTRTQKPWTLYHENGQKCPKSRYLTMPLESCIGGHGTSKSSRDPKTLDYSPRKRPEMPKITSFDDPARVMYRGSRGMEILLGPKNRGLQHTKTVRNARNHEFLRCR